MRQPHSHDDRGVPILNLPEKFAALVSCIDNEAYEDACGHLCDLLWHFSQKIEPGPGLCYRDLQAVVVRYGKNPTPVKED